jgi:uncharacterized phage infection (PIP) family protein YhgE
VNDEPPRSPPSISNLPRDTLGMGALAMPEPSLADVMTAITGLSSETKTALERLSTETKTRHESLASESRQRDTLQTERSARLEAKVDQSVSSLTSGLTTLHEDVTNLKSVVPKIEASAEAASTQARKAMDSYHESEGANQASWRSVMDRLEAQDKQAIELATKAKLEADMREAAKAEERRHESLAAKRMADARDVEAKRLADERDAKVKADAETERQKTERRKVYVSAFQAVFIALITSVGGYFAIRAAHQDTDAKIDSTRTQLTSLSKRLDSAPLLAVPGLPSNSMADTVTTVTSMSAAGGPPEPAAPAPAAATPAPAPRAPVRNTR